MEFTLGINRHEAGKTEEKSNNVRPYVSCLIYFEDNRLPW